MNAVAKKDAASPAGSIATMPVAESPTLLAVIARAATDPNTDVEKMERLMAMYERIEARRAETAFNDAMVEAQRGMRPISADASNPQTKSKYATYAKLDSALRPIYTDAGFSLSFDTGIDAPPDHVRVLCHVANAGYSRTHHIDMPSDGKGAKGGDVMTKTHAAGSAASYGMRYLLKMIFNVAVGEDDDDGNAAAANKAADAVFDPIYDRITLAQSLVELQKVKPDIEKADVPAVKRRNLIGAYNAQLRKLKEGTQ